MTTVTATATDTYGNLDVCTFNVTVQDVTPPVINCPTGYTVDVFTNDCVTSVFWAVPTATDNCGFVTITQTSGIAQGSIQAPGVYPVTYVASDGATPPNTSAPCSFNINVIDTENPVIINCPYNDQEISVDANCQAALPNYAATMQASDNCGYTWSQTPAAGTLYNAGAVVAVTVTATDAAGNLSTCSFNVNVIDEIDPVLACPGDIADTNDPGVCGAVVTYNLPVITDNCITCTAPTSLPNFTFVGVLLGHTYFRSNYTDTWTNAQAYAVSQGAHLATITSAAENTLVVGNGARAWIGLTDQVTEGVWQWVTGEPLVYTAWAPGEPNNSGNEDYAITNWSAPGNWNDLPNQSHPFIIEFDCAAAVPTQTAGLPSGLTFPVGTTTNTFTYTDLGGNTAECSFDVIITDSELPVISCAGLSATRTTSAGGTGECYGEYAWSHPVPTDNCGIAQYHFTYTNPDGTIDGPFDAIQIANGTMQAAANHNFAIGLTTVTYFVEDIHGNTNTCSFTVTVTDNEVPVFENCPPAGYTVDVFTNDCITDIMWNIPTATDNCNVTVTQTGGVPYGSQQAPGTYTIVYTASDNAIPVNTATCSFTIEISDTENPIIQNCPYNNQEIFVDADCEALLPDYTTTINAFDNCGTYTTTQFPLPGAGPYAAGDVVPVTITVTDGNGNSSTCAFDVVVLDDIDPVITCPADITQNNDPGLCGAVVTFADPVISDNCPLSGGGAPIIETFGFTNGVQTFTVPPGVTEITINALGAQGGGLNGGGGLGAQIVGTFNVTPGDILEVIVGEMGQLQVGGSNLNSSGGGGGSFVYNQSGPTLLVAAGGGGGKCNYNNTLHPEADGQSGLNGGNPSITGGFTPGTPGVGGNGGTSGIVLGRPSSGGGTGWLTSGTTAPFAGSGYPTWSGGQGQSAGGGGGTGGRGGFGGGGGGGNDFGGGGGGGGYSGGGGGDDPEHGGGGGSFNGGLSQTNSSGINMGDGLVTITYSLGASIVQVAGLSNGSIFPVGTTTNTFVLTDNFGNSDICSFDVTVTDTEIPVVDCSGLSTTITTSAGGTGDCEGQYTWTIPTPSDNCGVNNYKVTYTNPDGSIDGPYEAYIYSPGNPSNGTSVATRNFDLGVTTVTYYAEDAAGNTSSCYFTVTVTDNEAPGFVNCPAGQTFTIGADANCETGVIWSIPVASDNCGVISVQETSAGGSYFGDELSPGTYNIQYTASDGALPPNTATCNFTIEVVDDNDPYLVCQTDRTFDTETGVCNWVSAINELNPLLVRDNCPGDVLEYAIAFADGTNTSGLGNVPGGTVFPIGLNTISYTLTDASNNEVICSFTVTVEDNQIPVILVAPPSPVGISQLGRTSVYSNVNVNGTGDNIAYVAPGSTFTLSFNRTTTRDPDCGGCCGCITQHYIGVAGGGTNCLFSSTGNSSGAFSGSFTAPVLPGVYYITQTATWWFSCNQFGNPVANNDPALAIGVVIVGDGSGTECRDDITVNNDVDECGAVVDYGVFEVLDNCPGATLVQTEGFPNGALFPVGTTVNTFVVVDAAGNSNTCSFSVTVNDNTAPTITCPPGSPFVVDNTAGLCGYTAGAEFDATANDNCAVVSLTHNFGAWGNPNSLNGAFFPVGVTTVVWTALDEAGNSTACSIEIEVEDIEAPEFVTCPPDGYDVDVFTNDCVTNIYWVIPTATDNCSVTVVQTEGPAYGSTVGPGSYYIEYVATDGAGLTDTCSFTINVIDTENPVIINCPYNDQEIFVDADCEAVLPDYAATLQATDNCGYTWSQTPLPGTIFTAGDVVVVTVTATDDAGNSTDCTFNVNVLDDIDPVITCPENLSVNNDPGVCGAVVEYEVLFADNCTLTNIGGILNVLYVANYDNIEPANVLASDGHNVTTVLNEVANGFPALLGDLSTYDLIVWDARWAWDAPNEVFTNLETWVQNGGNILVTGYDVIFAPGIINFLGGTSGSDFGGNNNLTILGPGNIVTTGLYNIVGTNAYGVSDWDALNGPYDPNTTEFMGAGRWTLRSLPGGGNIAWLTGYYYDDGKWNNPGSGYFEALKNFAYNTTGTTDLNLVQTSGFTSGSTFPVGTTVNTFVVTDGFGNTAECSFEITVVDTEDPFVDCDGLELVTTTSADGVTGDCSYQYAWTHPEATDNCGILAYTVIYQNPDGTIDGPFDLFQITKASVGPEANRHFEIGTTIVTYTVDDVNGNSYECSWTVTVTDDEAPEFVVCPPAGYDVDVFTNDCVTDIFWVIPVAEDNCSVSVVQTQGPAYGSSVGPGSYYIEYVATDGAGLTDTCSFTINVIDTENPVIINCPYNDQEIFVDADCEAVLPNYAATLQATDNCNYTWSQTPLAGTVFTAGDVVVVTVTATDGAGNSTACTFNVNVLDTISPTIDCPADISVENDQGICGAVVTFEDPIVDDNCGINVTSGSEIFMYTGAIQTWTVPAGVTEVNITALGARGGNASNHTGGPGASMSGVFSVTPGQVLNILVGGSGLTNGCGSTGSGGGGTFVETGGVPLIIAGGGGGATVNHSGVGAVITNAGTSDNGGYGTGGIGGTGGVTCATNNWASGGGGGGFSGNGTNTTNGGNFTGGGQSYLNGGIGGTQNTNGANGGYGGGGAAASCTVGGGGGGGYSGGAGGWHSFVDVGGSSCIAPGVYNNTRYGGGGGGSYNSGTSQNNLPAINLGNGMVTITYANTSLVQTSGLPSGSVFPVGLTTNTFIVTDVAGNTAECSFDVIVTDTEDPLITCPLNASITTSNLGNTGDCVGQYEWQIPVPTDNCGVINYTVSYTNPDGTIDGPYDAVAYTPENPSNGLPMGNRNFELGTTTITYYVEDIHGNTSSCSFTVTVTDDEAPEFVVCPPAGYDVDVFTNDCVTDIYWVIPAATDNCSVTVVQTEGPAYGSSVGPGSYYIEYVATDGAGLTDTCSFTINVIDTENPVIINCPYNDQEIFVDDVCEVLLPDYTATMQATDNCDYIWSQTPVAGSVFTAGDVVVVSVTATDDAGNSTTCTFNVNVLDTISPVIICPVDISVSNDPEICGAVVEFEDPIATDNCTTISSVAADIITFDYTGVVQTWTVPAGVTSIMVDAYGAGGGISYNGGIPGYGGRVNTTLAVTPGEVLNIYVGGAGTPGLFQGGIAAGGYNGGGNGARPICCTGGGGGGSTDIRISGNALANRVVIAGGGGGAGSDGGPTNGGYGGDLIAGTAAEGNNPSTVEATGGTQLGGGIGGSLSGYPPPSGNGMLGQGGHAADNDGVNGGGGSGYYGGGAGTWAGGGGGSSYTDPVLTSGTIHTPNVQSGNGQLIIQYNVAGNLIQVQGLPSGSVFPVGTTTNTFIAIDEFGNTATCSFDVTVTDDEDPVIDCTGLDLVTTTSSDNILGDCVYRYSWAHPIPTDNCGIEQYTIVYQNPDNTIDGPYIVYVGSASSSSVVDPVRNFAVGTTIVTYYVEDIHGNTNSCSFTVTVTDDEDPYWNPLPQDLTLECDGTTDPYNQIQFWLNTNGGGIAYDNCGPVTYSNDYTGYTVGCSQNTHTSQITFTATDRYGNSTSVEVTLTVIDTQAPIITTMARDTIVECDGLGNAADLASWLANHGGAVAEDVCSEPLTWSYTLISTTETCGGTFTSRYAFRATDACGNVSVNTEALFIIEDTTAPQFDVLPQDLLVQCDGDGNTAELNGWLASYAGLVASDVCNEVVEIRYDLIQETDLCGITGSGLYRFRIWDACGNMNFADATFTIVDTIPPAISGGADMVMEECEDPPAGNYPEFDFWLTTNAGATAVDVCGSFEWSNNFHIDNWVFQCGNTKYVDVTFYATDICGNVDSITHRFSIGDVTPPEFVNCPRPDIVVDVPTNLCESYVNFSMPYAIDNCGTAVVEQTDTTGLTSGDLFPVGCTILEFTATDDCGNQTVCYLRIIVNDNHTPPVLECPASVETVNDPGFCGAIVDDLTPTVTDNCPAHVFVSYTIENQDGEIIGTGVEDVSGTEFPVGVNTVTYTAYDQPQFLITEVVQDGMVTGVEIGNFGPAAIDLGCAVVKRTNSSVDEEFSQHHGTVVGAGEVHVVQFTSIPAGEVATYSIEFKDRIVDMVTINDGLDGADIFRISAIDTDTNDDFEVVNACTEGSFGLWNPQLPHYADNGITTKMQSVHPNQTSCSFTVTVLDVESPVCGEIDTLSYTAGGMTIGDDLCVSSVFTLPAGKIAKINILDLIADVQDAGKVTVSLTGPDGTKIVLLENTCAGTSDINVNLDDIAPTNVQYAGCDPLGNGSTFAPLNSLFTFFGEDSEGDWTLELYTDSPNSGTLTNWTIEFLLYSAFDQQDIVAENDPGVCGADITWIHPYFLDNCIEGSMTVTYNFNNEVTGESYEITEIVLSSGGAIDLNGMPVTRFFEVGVTTITYTLTDQYGHISYCGFTVTVLDTEAPVFPNNCADFVVTLDPGLCYGNLTVFPDVTDNCGLESLVYYYPDGSEVNITQIPIGDNEIWAVATDIYGNSDTCVFNFRVIEFIPTNNTIACNDHVNISLDANCHAELTADMILEGDNYRCFENYCITITDQFGNIHPNSFDYSDAGQTFMVTVTDCLGSGNNCMSTVTIMEKWVPEIECPADTTVSCNADISPASLGFVMILNCEPFATIDYIDDFIDNGVCGNPRAIINRNWIVNDHQGNIVNCTQIITIEKSTLDEVIFPVDVLNASCHYANEHPESLHPDQTGYPTVNGIGVNVNDGLCMFSYLWTDEVYQYCGNSFEILRTWKVRDMCGPVNALNPRTHVQVIRVFDTTPPEICSCEDYVVNADAFSCEGSIQLPLPCITDDCSQIKSVKVYVAGAAVSTTGKYSNGTLKVFVYNMKLGTYPAKWIVEDACGNKSSCNFNIVVEDNFPPVAVCEQYKQVGVTFGGVAEVAAESFNSGSFDNCKPVWFKVWRDDGGCMDLNCDNTACTQQWFDDSVFFCCEDVSKEIMVTLRVFEVDPGPGPVNPSRMLPGGDLYGHFNDCMATTLVQDKSVPLMACQELTINCEDNTDPEFTGYPDVISTCGNYDLQYTDDLSRLDHCGIGYITRTWKVFVGGELKGQCNQRINVIETLPFDPLTIVFPYISEAQCLKPEPSGEQPSWTTNPCNVVEASIIGIDTFRFVEDACYKILREWAVIDWCTYKANTGAELNLDEYRYISGDKRAILDPAKFTEADRDGYYRFTEVIMVYDDTPANIVVTDTCLGVATCVTAQNTYRLEADSYETETDCGGEYEWTYVIHSECCDDVIQFSANNNAYKGANYQGGVSGRASEDKLDGDKASLLILPSLEQGRYKVTWTLSDGCGNVTTEYQYFDVVDKKAPTPFLVDIATATMTEDCMVEIPAIFFDKGACDNNCLASYDNCSDVLYFTYTPVLPKIDATWTLDGFGLYYYNPTTGARSNRNAYLAGNAHSWDPVRNTSGKVFFGPSKEIFVDVFVWDKFSLNEACDDGNFDFATVLLNLNSEDGDGCADEFNIVNGFTNNTANGEGIINVEVAAMQDGESKFVITDESGEFVHLNILGPVDFIPRKKDDYQNGVNTLDLILIQRHILGIEAMEGDQLIAADANANNTITAADIKQIRDLILGVTTKFPNNDSWVFVPKKYSLFVTLPTTLTFGGIKVGDTNRNATSNFNGELLTPRHRNTQKLLIDESEVIVGKTVEIDFYAKDFADVRGFQFTLNTPGLKYKGYQSGLLDLSQENIGVIRDGVTTMSWNEADGVFAQDEAVLFTLVFESAVNSDLGKLVSMTSEITPAESYRNDALESTNMALEFRGQTAEVFELYQNEPNPFTRSSVIRFTLPYAGEYTLKVFDATGKELKSITDQGQKGMNQEIIENPGLIPGLMYYQLSFDKFVSNKKMILVN